MIADGLVETGEGRVLSAYIDHASHHLRAVTIFKFLELGFGLG